MSNRSFSLRQTLFHRLFDQQTRSGRRFEALCGLLALLSVITIFIESSMGSQLTFTPQEWHLFIWIEIGFTLIFTFEYILRVIAWPRPVRYVFSFWGVIDLATMLPLYVLWLWPELAIHYFFAWRAMRAIRVLRILKLLRYMPALQSLWRAVINARHQLILFYAFVGIVMVSAGALMYAIEGEASGFTSLGVAVYWAVVTVTTVGYGDITPHSVPGRFVASVLILIGYSVIAIPTGILTAQMSNELQQSKRARRCPRCHLEDHNPEAHYCMRCGEQLPQLKETYPEEKQ
ncbi:MULTISPECIES: ion transporter [Enterobacteriaceae]|uniref:ion transporter n=1 Tax=Enterobacteriaceae TaxID=543 RepID=UPI000E7ED98D|nr:MULTISPECIES: ion transporter [Enterobacteriaceae]HAZ78048.1 transporter [Enterobacteriaceae bacterium]